MKAKLNKHFDNFIDAIDYIWDAREKIEISSCEGKAELFEHPKYLGFNKAKNFSTDIIATLYDASVDLMYHSFRSKKEFRKEVLSKLTYSFYDEFIVRFEK